MAVLHRRTRIAGTGDLLAVTTGKVVLSFFQHYANLISRVQMANLSTRVRAYFMVFWLLLLRQKRDAQAMTRETQAVETGPSMWY